MRAHINVSSRQVVHRLTKIRNNQTSFMRILVHIMHKIFMTGALSPQHLIYLMVPSLTGAPINNPIHPEAVSTHKQEQYAQECWIKIGPETFLGQLVTPLDLHKIYMRITRQKLKEYWKTVPLLRSPPSAS